MGLSASQGRLLLLTARQNDLEFRAQQISQKRLILSQQLEEIAMEYENATSNRQMEIQLYLTGGSADEKDVTSTVNLTYSDLISGTLSKFNSIDSGIQAGDDWVKSEYSSNIAYRLTDGYGAIVVSDYSEIPNANSGIEKTPLSQCTPNENGFYEVTTYINGEENREYYLAMKSTQSSDEEKEKFKSTTNGVLNLADYYAKYGDDAKNEAFWDEENGTLCLNAPDGTAMYFTKDGKRLVKNANNEFVTYDQRDVANATTYKFKKDPDCTRKIAHDPENMYTQTQGDTTTSPIVPVEGADNKYTVTIDGRKIRYVVDESLKVGSTDKYGTKTSPNYLQDCLRNGKYLLEKGSKPSTDEPAIWNSISWDATGNISDKYYTEDDDKAKAKYDRLQQQIQNQDKKLEI